MVSVCLPSDALLQHLQSYLGFSYLGHGVSLHGCSSKAQPLPLILDKVAPPDLERGVAPLGPPASVQPLLLGLGVAPLGKAKWLSEEALQIAVKKKRSEKQRRKGKIYPFECRVSKNSKER